MINKDLWVSGLRKNIGSNFGKGWRVIGEASGLTKLTYVYQEFKGAGNKKTAKTLPIKWEPTSQVEIQEYAKAIKKLMLDTFPETTRLWSEIYLDDSREQ